MRIFVNGVDDCDDDSDYGKTEIIRGTRGSWKNYKITITTK